MPFVKNVSSVGHPVSFACDVDETLEVPSEHLELKGQMFQIFILGYGWPKGGSQW